MTYNFVTVTGSFPGKAGTVTFTPPPEVTDLTTTVPVLGPGTFAYALSGGSFTSAPLLATDNVGLLPPAWSYQVTVALAGQKAYSYPALIPAANGTTATLSSLPVSASGGGSTEGFNNPMSAAGDMITGGASGVASRLAGNTTAVRQYLTQTGTGSASTAPAWGTITTTDLPAATTSTQGAVILDAVATDIQPPGTQSAGGTATTKATYADHVHPPGLNPLPSWTGYTIWTGDPMTGSPTRTAATIAALYASGNLYVTRFVLGAAVNINGFLNFYWVQPTGGTPANCFAGLYDSGGNRKYATTDLTSTATGAQRLSMSLSTLAAGTYYFASLVGTQGVTGGGFALFSNASSVFQNASTDTRPYRMGVLGAQSTLPTTLTYSSFAQGNAYPWFAID